MHFDSDEDSIYDRFENMDTADIVQLVISLMNMTKLGLPAVMIPFTEDRERWLLLAVHLLSGTYDGQYDADICQKKGKKVFIEYTPGAVLDDEDFLH